MAWVTPRTWAIGEALTAALLNAHIRDNLNSLRSLNDTAIRVYRTSASQSIPNDSRTPITWQAAAYQVGVTWSSGTNPTRLTVPTAGWYLLECSIRWTSSSGNIYGVGWHRGSSPTTQYDMQRHPGNGQDTTSGIELVLMAAGDYIEVYGYQDSGVARNAIGGGEYETSCSLSLMATVDLTTPAWRSPRTWADGEIVTAAMLNSEIRDRLRTLRGFNGAAAQTILDDDQSISQKQRGAIPWQVQNVNVGTVWDGSSKFTAPYAGLYLVAMHVEWLDSNATPLGCGYRINDRNTNFDSQFQNTASAVQTTSMVDLVWLEAGDFLEFYAYEDGDESSSVHGGTDDRTRASVSLLAAS